MITVGALRRAIKDLPDDAPVLVRPQDGVEYQGHIAKGEHVPNWVVCWGYNTREVYNAYQANDDRYDQSSVLLIELGTLSP